MYSLIYRRSPLLPSILSPLINSWTISQVSANFGLNNYWNLYPVEKFYPFLRNNNLVRSLSLSLETESQSCQRCLKTFKPITSSLFFQQLLQANFHFLSLYNDNILQSRLYQSVVQILSRNLKQLPKTGFKFHGFKLAGRNKLTIYKFWHLLLQHLFIFYNRN